MTDQYEDGNAMAGPLREIFAVDLTAARGQCVHCGLSNPVAALRVYSRAPGPGRPLSRLRRGRAPAGAHTGFGVARPQGNGISADTDMNARHRRSIPEGLGVSR